MRWSVLCTRSRLQRWSGRDVRRFLFSTASPEQGTGLGRGRALGRLQVLPVRRSELRRAWKSRAKARALAHWVTTHRRVVVVLENTLYLACLFFLFFFFYFAVLGFFFQRSKCDKLHFEKLFLEYQTIIVLTWVGLVFCLFVGVFWSETFITAFLYIFSSFLRIEKRFLDESA